MHSLVISKVDTPVLHEMYTYAHTHIHRDNHFCIACTSALCPRESKAFAFDNNNLSFCVRRLLSLLMCACVHAAIVLMADAGNDDGTAASAAAVVSPVIDRE